MTQTIAQQIKWDFKTNGKLEIKNKNDKRIYIEFSDEFWTKYEYDSKNNQIYFEDSKGYWSKYEYDSEGSRIYFENSKGKIIDDRPQPCSDKEIVIDGVKYKLTKL